MQRRGRWNCEAEKENQNKQKNSEASFPRSESNPTAAPQAQRG